MTIAPVEVGRTLSAFGTLCRFRSTSGGEEAVGVLLPQPAASTTTQMAMEPRFRRRKAAREDECCSGDIEEDLQSIGRRVGGHARADASIGGPRGEEGRRQPTRNCVPEQVDHTFSARRVRPEPNGGDKIGQQIVTAQELGVVI